MQLDKFSTCKKMIYLLLVFQLLCCCGVLVALKLELDIQTICLLAKVLGRLIMVISAICIVLSILLVRYSRCTNCGKPVLMRSRARVPSATPGGFALSDWPVERASAGG